MNDAPVHDPADDLAEDATDEQLYAWFVRMVGGRDLTDDVIEVSWTREDGRADRVWLVISRAQLRSRAWAEYDIFDDRDVSVTPRSSTPVASGMHEFVLRTEEVLGSLGRQGRSVLRFSGDLWGWSDEPPPPEATDRQGSSPS